MAEPIRRTEPLVLYGVMILVGIGLIAIGVFSRDSIGLFAGWLISSVGIVTVLAVPILRRKRNNGRRQ